MRLTRPLGAPLGPALSALLSHWTRRPAQLIALLAGLAAATALWSGVQALNAEARASYDRAAAMLGGVEATALVSTSGGRIPLSQYAALRRAGWAVSPVLDGRLRLQGGARLRLLGVEPLTAPAGVMAGGLTPALSEAGGLEAFVSEEGFTLASAETVAALGGAGVRPIAANGALLPPLRAAEAVAPDLAFVDIGQADRLLAAEGGLSRLLLDTDAPPGLTPLETVHGGALRQVDGIAATGAGDLDRLTDSFHMNLTAFGLLAFVVGLFIVHAAIGLAFEQRKPMLRTLRALGLSARQLAAALLIELLALALIAGVIGVIGGYAVAALLLPDVVASLRGLYGAPVAGELSLGLDDWLLGVGMALAGALAAAGVSLARAVRLPLLASAQPAAWAAAQARAHRLQAALGAGLGLAAAALTVFGQGLLAGFAGLAALLLGAALLLPPALGLALRAAERQARRPLTQWLLADARQQIASLSLALMALLLALSANIGVGTMVESFRTTFLTWLDQRLAAEVYLIAGDDETGRAIADWAPSQPSVTDVLPTARADVRLDGLPVELVGFRDAPTFRESWPLLSAMDAVWDAVAAGDAAILSEQLARRLDVTVGGVLSLPTAAGPWTLSVGGIYADYGNPLGQVSVAIAPMLDRYPDARQLSYGFRLAPDQAQNFMASIAETFGDDAAQLTDQAALKRFSRQVFEQTFAVTAALNTLTLAVAGLALLASLYSLSAARVTQLAPLWAVGLPRRALARLDLAKTLTLAALTALLAVPLGLALAWHLLAVVNVQAFGWRLPLGWFPLDWLRLVLIALAAATLAALPPLVRLSRTAPADLARAFAQER